MGRAMIVSAGVQSNAYLAARLTELGWPRPVMAASGAEARRRMLEGGFELVVVNAPLPDEVGSQLCLDAAEQSEAGVIFLAKAALCEELADLLSAQGVLVVPRPFSAAHFVRTVRTAAAGCRRMQRLRAENDRLQAKLTQLRLISRAKCLLIQCCGLTEAEAHRRIEKEAMDTRRPREAVARALIEELGGAEEP